MVRKITATSCKQATQCKIRGFTLDEQGSAMLNFETMKRHIIAEIKDPEKERRNIGVPVSLNFGTNRTTKKMCITPKVKKYGLVFDKRVVKNFMAMNGWEKLFCYNCHDLLWMH